MIFFYSIEKKIKRRKRDALYQTSCPYPASSLKTKRCAKKFLPHINASPILYLTTVP